MSEIKLLTINEEKLKEIVADQSFMESILAMDTPGDVQTALKEKGIEMSIEDISIMGQLIAKMVEKETTNLTQKDLEDISGGSKGSTTSPESSASPFDGYVVNSDKNEETAPTAGELASAFASGVTSGFSNTIPEIMYDIKNPFSTKKDKAKGIGMISAQVATALAVAGVGYVFAKRKKIGKWISAKMEEFDRQIERGIRKNSRGY